MKSLSRGWGAVSAALVFLVAPAILRADNFGIEFMPIEDNEAGEPIPFAPWFSFSGGFTTDGTCEVCDITDGTSGMLTIAISPYWSLAPGVFTINPPTTGGGTFDRESGSLDVGMEDFDDVDMIHLNPNGTYNACLGGCTVGEFGRYAINGVSPIPEPSAVILLFLALALVAMSHANKASTAARR